MLTKQFFSVYTRYLNFFYVVLRITKFSRLSRYLKVLSFYKSLSVRSRRQTRWKMPRFLYVNDRAYSRKPQELWKHKVFSKLTRRIRKFRLKKRSWSRIIKSSDIQYKRKRFSSVFNEKVSSYKSSNAWKFLVFSFHYLYLNQIDSSHVMPRIRQKTTAFYIFFRKYDYYDFLKFKHVSSMSLVTKGFFRKFNLLKGTPFFRHRVPFRYIHKLNYARFDKWWMQRNFQKYIVHNREFFKSYFNKQARYQQQVTRMIRHYRFAEVETLSIVQSTSIDFFILQNNLLSFILGGSYIKDNLVLNGFLVKSTSMLIFRGDVFQIPISWYFFMLLIKRKNTFSLKRFAFDSSSKKKLIQSQLYEFDFQTMSYIILKNKLPFRLYLKTKSIKFSNVMRLFNWKFIV